MKQKPNPLAIISQHPKPCFVCDTPTKRIRSNTHLDGPPTDPKDFVRICLACDADWSSTIYESRKVEPAK